MSSRHRARESALQILYSLDTGEQKAPSELIPRLNQHFDHFKVPEDLREFASELVSGSLLDRESIDELLERHATHWKVSRMASLDRCLLRMAVNEMLRFPETSSSIIIDEAIELGKQFGTPETPGFVNGILDSIRKSLNRP